MRLTTEQKEENQEVEAESVFTSSVFPAEPKEPGLAAPLGPMDEENHEHEKESKSKRLDSAEQIKESRHQVSLSDFISEDEELSQENKTLSSILSKLSPRIPQEVIDQALRIGSNEVKSRLSICAYFMKKKSVAEDTSFLKEHYGTNGAGFYHENRQVSIWYNEDGIHIDYGTSALTDTALTVSWEQAAKRIRELLVAGCYMAQDEIDNVEAFELQGISDSLEYLCREIQTESADQYFPTIMPIHKTQHPFPEITAQISELLKQPENLKKLVAECEVFCRDYKENREILRFHFHRPDKILQRLQDLQREPVIFTADPTFLPPQELFISSDEIDKVLRRGDTNYRLGVYSCYCNNKDNKAKRVAYLQQYHGPYFGHHGGNDDITYTSKGISFGHRSGPKVELSWNVVEQKISALIKENRFLSDQDRSKMPMYEKKRIAQNVVSFFRDTSEDNRPYHGNSIGEYRECVDQISDQLDSPEKIEKIYQMMIPVMENTPEDDRRYNDRASEFESFCSFRNGTFSLFGEKEPVKAEQEQELKQEKTQEIAQDMSEPEITPVAVELTDLQKKAIEIAKKYENLPMQDKIGIIAQAFGCTSGKIETSPCSNKWRGTSDISIRFDNGTLLFLGNKITSEAKTAKVQNEYVTAALVQYNPEIIATTKEIALTALIKREAIDNAIAAEKGLKPYTLLNVEFNNGAHDQTGGYIGWYYVTLAVDGKIYTHLETGLNHDIADGKVSDTPKRATYFPAGSLKESDVDYVFNNVGFSSASSYALSTIPDDVLDRAEKALAERRAATLSIPDKDTFSIYQLKQGDETRYLRYEPYAHLKAAGNVIDKANYELVYSSDLLPDMTLENIFEQFNHDHPGDFKGHSLSVSDVVVLHQDGQDVAHYVDSVGFKEIPEFLREQEKSLTPDDLQTGETIKTPRGTFYVSAMSREQIESVGYTFHHQSDDGKYYIMTNSKQAFAIAVDQQPEREIIRQEQENSIGQVPESNPEQVKTTVHVDWSEHPAFYNRTLQPDGTYSFEDRFRDLSFPVANKLFGILDKKQHYERSNPEISVGHYHKTKFQIDTVIDGQPYSYEGRQDFGDGEGDLLAHLWNCANHYANPENPVARDIKTINGIEAQKEAIASWEWVRDTVIPFLESQSELSPDEEQQLATILATEPEWFPNAGIDREEPDRVRDVTSSTDYQIDDDNLGIAGPKERFSNNIAAINVLHTCESENRPATPEEQQILSQYVGWGGLADAFDHNKKAWSEQYKTLQETLTSEEYQSARASVNTAFYTPPVVIKGIYDKLEQMGLRSGKILDPSCGVGHFFGLLPTELQQIQKYGIELDSVSGRIAKLLYPSAQIAVQGYENSTFQDNTFDAIVGNVPFGQFRVNDKRYNAHNFLIHDYFFAKSLDKVRPGGIVALITSSGTMDKTNPSIRRYIAQRAELLGAVRLPDNTFEKNAGTTVTSDILFFQKRDGITKEINNIPWLDLAENENGITMNRYFVEHPEMVLGEMELALSQFNKWVAVCKANSNVSLENALSYALENITGSIKHQGNQVIEETTTTLPADPQHRAYSFVLHEDKLYFQEGNREGDRMEESSQKGKGKERILGMMEIRDCVRKLLNIQLRSGSDEEIAQLQEELNRLYDDFTKKHGLINDNANAKAFKKDSSYALLCSLEELDENKKLKNKAAIFTKRTVSPHLNITHADSAQDALTVSMTQRAYVDIQYMMELTGMDEADIYNDLKGSIFLNPYYDGTDTSQKYLYVDEYLSGNVREKLRTAKAIAETNPEFTDNVTALERVQPVDLDATEIKARLGAPWIEPEIINEFMYQLLNTRYFAQRNIKAEYAPISGRWYISSKKDDMGNTLAVNTYGTSRINAYEIIEASLNQKAVQIYDTVAAKGDETKRVLNEAETQIAQNIQKEIESKFEDWVWSSPQRRNHLIEEYNERFNSIRNRDYDGSTLPFSGMNPEITLRPHQKNAVARILYGGNTLLGHVVGAGKTFTMAAAAMELKRLELCHKPVFIVPKNIVGQFASDFIKLYPGANLLITTEDDFSTHNRQKFTSRIATGEFDGIVMSHSQFEKIKCSVEWQRQELENQLEELMEGIEEARARKGSRSFSVKEMERCRKQLMRELQKLNDQEGKDDTLDFEELGIDRLFVDEADLYKNLYVQTSMTNVAGISNSVSKKASDLYLKTKYLNKITNYQGVIFATGTPISNSVAELYTMQRYLQYDKLVASGIRHFDAWAAQFGETTAKLEISPTGKGLRLKTRFSKYNNMPELMTMFRSVADLQTEDMLNLPVPNAHYEIVSVKPSGLQKEMVESLVERSEAISKGLVSPAEDNMLVVTNDGKRLALDQRLINPELPDFEGSKVNACVDNIYRIWEENSADRLTQLVFCDTSTPKSSAKTKAQNEEGIDENTDLSAEDVLELFAEKRGASSFNVYDDIKTKLIAKGVPEDEIAFIHDADTDKKKQDLFAKVRNGSVRVLLGSTQKMGAGTNVQDKLVAIHDLDCPWRPRDLEQRRGRIVRQGNQNKDVHIYRYVTEQTFDAYLYQTIENKQRFISQIFTSKTPTRSMEEVDAVVLNYGEIKALATGNPLIMERSTLESEVQQLTIEKAGWKRQKYNMEDYIASYPKKREFNLSVFAKAKQDLEHISPFKESLENERFPGMTVDGKHYTDRQEAAIAIVAYAAKHGAVESPIIGEYCGLQIQLCSEQFEAMIKLKGNLEYKAKLYTKTPALNIKALNGLIIDGIKNRHDAISENLENEAKSFAEIQGKVNTPFAKEEELQVKKARLDEVTKLLVDQDLETPEPEPEVAQNQTEHSELTPAEESKHEIECTHGELKPEGLIDLSGETKPKRLVDLSGETKPKRLVDLSGETKPKRLVDLSGETKPKRLVDLSGENPHNNRDIVRTSTYER